MNEPYENLYLGAFVFALGVAAGKSGQSINDSCAQLLQQTPGDKPIGDLLAVWEGRSFIFEFKRRESGVKTERHKSYCTKQCPEDCNEHRNFIFDYLECSTNEKLLEKSLKCHFVAFGGESEKPSLSFMPYAKILDNKKQGNRDSLEEFTSKMLLNSSLGLIKGEFEEYYNFLLGCVEHHGGTLSGVVINIGDNGALNTVNVQELQSLVGNMLNADSVPQREPYEPPASTMVM